MTFSLHQVLSLTRRSCIPLVNVVCGYKQRTRPGCDIGTFKNDRQYRSSSSESFGEGSKHSKPTWPHLQHVCLRLSDSLPRFLHMHMDYTFYEEDVELIDRVFNKNLRGLDWYRRYFGLLSVVTRLIYPLCEFKVLNVTPMMEDGTVRVRCRLMYLTIFELIFYILLKFKFRFDDLRKFYRWSDTYHIYQVNGLGNVYKHIIDRVVPDEERSFNKKPAKLVNKVLGNLTSAKGGKETC